MQFCQIFDKNLLKEQKLFSLMIFFWLEITIGAHSEICFQPAFQLPLLNTTNLLSCNRLLQYATRAELRSH